MEFYVHQSSLTSGPTLWIMRSFFDMGAREVSSWVASVSVTTLAVSSSSRGRLDIADVPGVADTGEKVWLSLVKELRKNLVV